MVLSLERETIIFLVVLLAMIAFSYTEAVLEGYEGWAKDRKV